MEYLLNKQETQEILEYLKKYIDDGDEILYKLIKKAGSATGNEPKVFLLYDNDTTNITVDPDLVKEGDFCIIVDDDKNAAGYIYTLQYGWLSFSGNVNASNVLFTKDILCAGNYTQVGNVTKSQSGTTTIPAEGRTIEDVFTSIFTQELQPSKTDPSVNITFSQAGAKEVGTTVNPSYSVSLNAGSYTYGPATGVTATAWSVTDSDGNSDTAASASFPSFVVTDTTNYKITAVATHTDGADALTNIGNVSNPLIKIAAGTKSKTSSSVTGYRPFFYGALTTDSSVPLTSAIIRGLTNGGNYNNGKSLVINPITGGKRYIVAIPASNTRAGLTSVILPNSLNAQVVTQYITETVQVEGKNGFIAVDYKVYVYEPASIGINEIHNITLG